MADNSGKAPKGVLEGCRIAFVPSRFLAPSMISEYASMVQKHGAEVLEPKENGRLCVGYATHIIANSIDFEDFVEANAHMVPVVNTSWIQCSLNKNKQFPLRPFSPDPRMIFSAVNLTFADIPDTDKATLGGACGAMGGMVSKDLTKAITHICALSMDHEKCKIVEEKGLNCKIVLPHWFDDCFKLGKKIDEGPYLLPNPDIIHRQPDDAMAIPPNQHLEGAVTTRPDTLPTTDEKSCRGELTVFRRKKVMLAWDLSLNMRFLNIIRGLIESGGGQVVDVDDEACDMLICQYRDGEQYIRAAQSGKDIGNLAWLFYLITHNEWSSPFHRLLHYPVPRDGIPGFKDLRITLSNYGGESRVYLENLVRAAGATYTKTMKSDNTHLITARNNSEKCDAAKEWNVNMVNHLWIEESYAKCQAQSPANERYMTFPSRTNLGEIIGQTFLEEPLLRKLYYPGGEEKMDAKAKRKRAILEAAHENTYHIGPAAGLPMMGRPEPELSVLNDNDVEGGAKTKRNSRKFATPARGRHVKLGKENDTPAIMSSGSRSAKDKAISKLHGLAPDLALYEKERKRTSKDGHAPWGGKRAADRFEKAQAAANSSSPALERPPLEDDDEEVVAKRPSKKQKASSLPAVEMRIILTGFGRWIENSGKEEAERKKLRSLGIQIVQENQPCDYLAAPSVVRTAKFLKTLAKGADIINCKFIDDVLDGDSILPVKQYVLKDKAFEQKYGEPLQRSIARARANKGRLLWNIPIYCTENIKNGVESYKAVAEANGAIFKTYRARSGTTIRPTSAEEDGGAGPEPVYLISCGTEAERSLWPKFEKMALDGHMEPRVVSPDWLLEAALKQKVTFNEDYLASNFWAPR